MPDLVVEIEGGNRGARNQVEYSHSYIYLHHFPFQLALNINDCVKKTTWLVDFFHKTVNFIITGDQGYKPNLLCKHCITASALLTQPLASISEAMTRAEAISHSTASVTVGNKMDVYAISHLECQICLQSEATLHVNAVPGGPPNQLPQKPSSRQINPLRLLPCDTRRNYSS